MAEFDPAGSFFDFEGGELLDPDQGGLPSLFEGGDLSSPFDLLSGLPSFAGGDAGPAFSSASAVTTTLQAAPFNFSSGGTPEERTVANIMPLLLAGLALWLILK